MRFALITALSMAAAPLSGQSLVERALAEDPICDVRENAYELCLVADQIVANSDILFLELEDGAAYFSASSGMTTWAWIYTKDRELSQTYATEFGPRGPQVPTTDLGALSAYDYGTFTYSTANEMIPGTSPYVVTLLDLNAVDVLVFSVFANMFQMPDNNALSDEQLQDHITFLGAFRPLSDT